MSGKVFIDTNILVYLYSEDEPGKRLKSQTLLEDTDSIISTQILNEFANILLMKFKIDQESVSKSILELSEKFTVVIPGLSAILKALSISKRFGYSYYDSLVIATSLENGCAVLYTEDMQNSQIIDDALTIVNPFK